MNGHNQAPFLLYNSRSRLDFYVPCLRYKERQGVRVDKELGAHTLG